MMPFYPVPEYLDSVISELNLEYLATGEIKVKFRNTRQKSIIAKVKPTKIDDNGFGTMGDITFYTGNKRRIIEQLNASQFDSVIGLKDSAEVKEQILADSLETVIAAKSEHDEFIHTQDSLSNLTDSLALNTEQREVVRKKLDAILWADDSDSTSTEDRLEVKGDLASKPVSFADLDQLVKLAEKEKKAKVAERERNRRAAAIKKLQEEEAASEEELRKDEQEETEETNEELIEDTPPTPPTTNSEEASADESNNTFAETGVTIQESPQAKAEVEQPNTEDEKSTKEDSRALESKELEKEAPVEETAAEEPQKKKEKKKRGKRNKAEEDTSDSIEQTPTGDNADTSASSEENVSSE